MTMNSTESLSFFAKIELRWHLLLRWFLMLWVKPRIQVDADGNTRISDSRPVCYVLNSYALSNVLILDSCCEKKLLARPLLPMTGLENPPERSYASLKRLRGLIFRRPQSRRHSAM